jgi:hypothetical protein
MGIDEKGAKLFTGLDHIAIAVANTEITYAAELPVPLKNLRTKQNEKSSHTW